MTVHRPRPTKSNVTQIMVWKCRFSWVGQIGERELEYDKITSRYEALSKTEDMLKPKKTINNYYEPKEYKDISF